PGVYRSVDGKLIYTLAGTTLTVTLEGEARHALTIEGYQPGDLGIYLPELSAPLIAEGTAAEELIEIKTSGNVERTPRIPPHDSVTTHYGAPVDRVIGHGGGDFIQVYDPKPGLIVYGDGALEDPQSDGDDFIGYTKMFAEIPSESIGLIAFGGGGKDVLNGTGGGDLFIGGSGHDVAGGGAGGDQLYGGSENDLLSGQEDADSVQGDGGNDRLLGGAGADLLSGGAGEDWLYGDSGTRGFNWDGEKELFLRPQWLPLYLDPSVANELWWVHFDQHGVVNQAVHHWAVIDDVQATEVGQDQLYGGDGKDHLFGGGGDDHLHGDRGADTLQGEAGADRLWGGEGRDVLWGDKDPDTYDDDTKIIDSLTIEYTSELDQQVLTTAKFNWRKHQDGAEVAGDDTLDGGSENDLLHGGGGNDSYVFGYGYDVDLIDDASGIDVIRLGAGITAQDVRLSSTGDDLVIHLLQAGQGTGDQLIVSGWNAGRTVESMVFGDGTRWDADTLARHAGLSGSSLPTPPPSRYALGA
ncbi:MAG: calcium-binding protein, partial [Candidatus Methylomirabilales bacterium]